MYFYWFGSYEARVAWRNSVQVVTTAKLKYDKELVKPVYFPKRLVFPITKNPAANLYLCQLFSNLLKIKCQKTLSRQ